MCICYRSSDDFDLLETFIILYPATYTYFLCIINMSLMWYYSITMTKSILVRHFQFYARLTNGWFRGKGYGGPLLPNIYSNFKYTVKKLYYFKFMIL